MKNCLTLLLGGSLLVALIVGSSNMPWQPSSYAAMRPMAISARQNAPIPRPEIAQATRQRQFVAPISNPISQAAMRPTAATSDPQSTVQGFLDALQRGNNDAAWTFLSNELRQRIAATELSFAQLLGYSKDTLPVAHTIQTTMASNREARVLVLFAVDDQLYYRELVLESSAQGWRISAFNNMVVEEHRIVSNQWDQPYHSSYTQHIKPDILEQRRAWREPAVGEFLNTFNTALRPFDYQLAPTTKANYDFYFFYLYRDDTLVKPDLTAIWPVAVTETGDDFVMMAQQFDGPTLLIHDNYVESWNLERHALTPPVFIGDELMTVESDPEFRVFAMRCGDEIVYRFTLPVTRHDSPIKGLSSWDGHWVAEVDGQVLVDGKSLNQQLGYNEIFGWQLVNKLPFYFFKQYGRIGVSYAGQILPYQYDEIVHYAHSEAATFNTAGNDAMVWFHARNDGTWYYVEMGVYR
jgi:hypothetical protein